MIGRWVPPAERARAISLNASGVPLGAVFALVVTPIIVEQMGWPWAFYLFGVLGLIWAVPWAMKVTASPADDRDPRRGRAGRDPRHRRRTPHAAAAVARAAVQAGGVGGHRRALLQQLVALRAAGLAADVRQPGPRRRLRLGRGLHDHPQYRRLPVPERRGHRDRPPDQGRHGHHQGAQAAADLLVRRHRGRALHRGARQERRGWRSRS